MPSDARAHQLGPHVVGTRVVVRRVLPGRTGPSGGPALTDLLGICTAWGDGVCVVQPDAGPPVTIALADVVAGKPVPPRPSPRLRISPHDAQLRATSLFPRLHTAPLGDWTLRHSPVHAARRANSVLAMQPSGLADPASYDGVVAFYAGLGRRPIAAVLRDSAPEELFLGRGWVPESGDHDTVFQIASVARSRRALGHHAAAEPGDLVRQADHDLLTVRLGDRAAGVAALSGDWVGVRGLHVDAAHRRRGLATAVLDALLEWAAERGAVTAYLQVLADNEPALGLYDRLGFVEHHRYRYLAAPE